MPHHAETTLRIDASASKVWEIISDFSSVERYSAKVQHSPIVGATTHGVGTQRRCTFYDQSTVMEEIVDYTEGKQLRIALSEFSMPLKSLEAVMEVTPVTETSCDVLFRMEYVVKYGPAGWMLGSTVMKGVIRGVTRDVLRGLAYHAVTGKVVGETLP